MKKRLAVVLVMVFVLMIAGCGDSSSAEEPIGAGSQMVENAETDVIIEDNQGEQAQEQPEERDYYEHAAFIPFTENVQDTSAANETNGSIVPTKEQVLTARETVLDGMTTEQIKRLTENIKVANIQMEQAYLYDNIFGKLEDENSLYWNYFDQKGDIQIGWAYDGDYFAIKEIRERENLTTDEFYEKYGTPVVVYNRFDADNFIDLIVEMQESIQNEDLREDLQNLIDETALAKNTHDMEHANNIYKILHDMDYYLLRYGLEDVGIYVKDTSILSKYYGVLTVYQQ